MPQPPPQWGRERRQLQRDDATLPHYQRCCCCMDERAIFPVSAMLLIYTYSLLPARALCNTLLFVLCCKCETKSVVDLDNSATHSRAMTTIADVSKRSLIVESTVSSSWYRRASTLQFYCSSSFNLWVNWINFGPLRPRGHSPMQPGHVSRLDPASRRHW